MNAEKLTETFILKREYTLKNDENREVSVGVIIDYDVKKFSIYPIPTVDRNQFDFTHKYSTTEKMEATIILLNEALQLAKKCVGE